MTNDEASSDSNPDNKIAGREVQEMLDSGDILEADGNLWQLPLATFKVKGKRASEQLIEERQSY
jgi:hypothetical protein